MKNIKVAVIGATGYVGEEILRILSFHPNVEIKYATSVSYSGRKFSSIYYNFNKITDICCSDGDDLEKISKRVDVVFLALPHGIASNKVNDAILSNCKVIDLGADFRLKNSEVYENWYKVKHGNPKLLETSVYGLCEINRAQIKQAALIANPGCYTTCGILSLFPLVKDEIIDLNTIIIDAKSGVTGAGRNAGIDNLYCELNENAKAYKICSHRHTPEIEQELSFASGKDITLSFVPYLVPMNRGIIITVYAKLVKNIQYEEIRNIYEKYYKDEYFIRILNEDDFPETRWVKGSNFCDIGFKVDKRTGNIIVVASIDNLIKGAAGQAIQNMNIMFGFDEKTALATAGMFPF